jgi:HAD superfamily hydrolase (TIGR01509 family)
MPLAALIFDVDGTLAETEELHRYAFNTAFAEAGLDWVWSENDYGELLKTTGGKERIAVHAASLRLEGFDPRPLHARKTEIYNQALKAGGLSLRPGVEALIDYARARGLSLAIATTTSRENVLTLLETTLGPASQSWFKAICTGEDVVVKKPDPEVYHLALARLQRTATECLAFEDSRNGVLAARGAGLEVIVTPSLYSAGEDFSGASAVIDDVRAFDFAQWANEGAYRFNSQTD